MWCLSQIKAIMTSFRKQALAGKRHKKVTQEKSPNWYKKQLKITAWLDSHFEEIISVKMVVFILDECHLLWGDICGYIWGKTSERIEVPVLNEREKQTYYGALNYYSGYRSL